MRLLPTRRGATIVKERLPTLGPMFPFQLVAGNHEEQGGSDGYIMNHAACLPDRLNSTGFYAARVLLRLSRRQRP